MNGDPKHPMSRGEPGQEARYSPKYIAAARRRTRQCALFGILLAIVALGSAIHAHLNHTLVDMGPRAHYEQFPPWLVGLMGVSLLAGCAYLLRK